MTTTTIGGTTRQLECSLPDLDRVREFLREACDRGSTLDALVATYIRAGANGPVRVLYESPGHNGTPLRISARRLDASRGRRIEAEINVRSTSLRSSTGFIRPAVYSPALELLFQVFPIDDKLPSLPIATDASAMTLVLRDVFHQRDASACLESVAVHVTRYKPGRKCVLRHDLTWAGGEGSALPRVVWGRVARRSKFVRTRHILSPLHTAAHRVGFDVPEPLGSVPDLALEFFGHLPGVPLLAAIERTGFADLCRCTGAALRRFHELPLQLDEVFGIDAQLERLSENATEFAWLLPSQERRIAALHREIAGRLQTTATSPLRLIHRDFHGNNILVAGDRLGLIDFEDCAMGEPADDVGSNWAQLTWYARKAGALRDRVMAAREAFLDAYLGTTYTPAALSLRAYAAMHCFLYAHQCLRHPLDDQRREAACAMLSAAEDVLDRGLT